VQRYRRQTETIFPRINHRLLPHRPNWGKLNDIEYCLVLNKVIKAFAIGITGGNSVQEGRIDFLPGTRGL
jgi:hypothetical protein